jgi:hypothetical protein
VTALQHDAVGGVEEAVADGMKIGSKRFKAGNRPIAFDPPAGLP